MSYKLDKPYTDFERADFVVLHNHQNGRKIYEDDTAIYALEPNEMVQDGQVIINPNYEQECLERAKTEKVELNDTLRDEALLGGVIYQNVLFDSDTDQKINLLSTVETLSNEDTIVWYGMNNEPLLCNKEDLYNIGYLIKELTTYCWTHNSEIKQEINNASTIEELDNIVIDYSRKE